MAGKLRLRSDLSRLNQRGADAVNVSEASYDMRVAWETARQWISDPSVYERVSLDQLAALLMNVYGLSKSEFMRLRITDLFELKD